jgi:formylglycine-generating enzyme required for sulfatase activity
MRGTSPVDWFSPQGDSPYGCADMVGNIWEWCADWYDANEYKNRENRVVKDPRGPEKGLTRVLRGGSFGTNRSGNRCADRLPFNAILCFGRYGFRLACSSGDDER